ncbi:MAG: apolipoprotein N-acyltransferase [Gammaproteobacteria bacterium]|nr:apolipoprotein N-acyltransferase [Gammaproteobacteria bacterium]
MSEVERFFFQIPKALRFAAALGAGACLPSAFAPLAWWPVAPVAFAVLLVCVYGSSSWTAAGIGFVFGAGMFGTGVSWIAESFQYNHVHGPVVWVLSAAFVLFLALFPALWAWLCQYLRGRMGRWAWSLGLAPALWILIEWLRGWFLTGFTWLQFGISQVDGPAAGLAPITGAYGVGWLVAATGGALALLVLRGPRPVMLAVVLAAVWLSVPLLRTIEWTRVAGEPFKAALVQGNYSQNIKWLPQNRGPTLHRYRALTEQHADAQLIVWPETAVPMLANDVRPYLDELDRFAQDQRMSVLVGAPFRDPSGKHYFNSMLGLGLMDGVYHKQHLVPFGEYLPLAWLTGPIVRMLGVPAPSFSRWSGPQPLLAHGSLRLGLSICYEAAFGAEILQALPEATVLVNVSNDAWFGDTLAPFQHLQIGRMRALETGRYMLRATNTGISAIIAPDGRIIARSPQFATHVVRGEAVPRTGMTPYAVVADWPVVWAAGAIVGWLVWRKKKHGQHSGRL